MPFPASPADLERLGFRLLPVDQSTKRPKPGISGFEAGAADWTTAARNFSPTDAPAILCGPCPALGLSGDWLMVLDRDGDAEWHQLEAALGLALPPTLSSKGDRHRYYRVAAGPLRDQIQQWQPLLGRGPERPKIDLKWAGGYAIEANAWDAPVRVDAIAILPGRWLEALLATRARLAGSAARARIGRGGAPAPVPMGALPEVALAALAAIWPDPGGGCHDAALALGGLLSDSDWALPDVMRFAAALFDRAGTTNRCTQVAYSWTNKRLDPDSHAYGLPTLIAALRGPAGGKNAAVKALRDAVPGLNAPPPDTSEAFAFGVATVQAGQLPSGATGATPGERWRPSGDLLVGSHGEVARRIVRSRLRGSVADLGEIWQRDGRGVWQVVPRDKLARWVLEYDGFEYDDPQGKRRAYHAAPERVIDLIHSLRARAGFFARPPLGVAFKNGFLDLSQGAANAVLRPLSRGRVFGTLPCNFEPNKKYVASTWYAYLKSIWGRDDGSLDVEAVRLVHEMIGYLLVGQTAAQKIFVLLGPTRSGKGVLLRLIQEMFGQLAVSFKANRLGGQFGLTGLMGKRVAYDPDWRRPPRDGLEQVVEQLLAISACDTIEIPRKYQDPVSARLGVRLIIATNPPFGMADTGGAIGGRMKLLTFPRSFLDREDVGLFDRLKAELPAIVQLCLGAVAGRDGLEERSWRFVEPASSAEERETIAHLENPMKGFLDDECEFGPEFSVPAAVVYARATQWREDNGHKRISNQMFGETLRARGATQRKTGGSPRVWVGVRLRPSAPTLTLVQSPPDVAPEE